MNGTERCSGFREQLDEAKTPIIVWIPLSANYSSMSGRRFCFASREGGGSPLAASPIKVHSRERSDADLLLVEGFEGSPRHIWYHMPASISQSDICRLHERVDVDDLKHAHVLVSFHMVPDFRR